MRTLQWLEQRPLWARLLLKVLALALLGYADYATGPEISFSIFYLIPVATTAWIDGRLAGVFMSLVCGGVWLGADLSSGQQYTQSWIPFWSMTVRIGFFVVVSAILARLKLSLNRERELSRRDPLTGLWNARYFLELGEREVERCRRRDRPVTIADIDADDFKGVNDSLGHAGGDALLREVGGAIKQAVRREDIAARLGGDEFALLFPETASEPAAFALKRVRESLDRRMRESGRPVTFSVGAVTCPAPPPCLEEMIKAADELMYRVKKDGKGAIRHEERQESSAPGQGSSGLARSHDAPPEGPGTGPRHET
jgi:diguanylate cyclase (GGDEF)-like protein